MTLDPNTNLSALANFDIKLIKYIRFIIKYVAKVDTAYSLGLSPYLLFS